jgi:ADP-heptose:LPS heptosyltransferase
LIWFAPADYSLAKQLQALEPRAAFLRWDSLAESMAALRLVKLYVGPDTGTAHFAAAAGVPCVVLFAKKARPDVWSPYGVSFISIQAGWNQAVSQLPVEFIANQVSRLLKGECCTEIINLQPLRYYLVPSFSVKASVLPVNSI